MDGSGSCHTAARLSGVMALVRCAVLDDSCNALQISPPGAMWQLYPMLLQPGIHAPVTAVTGTGFFVLPQGGWHDKRIASSSSGFVWAAVLFPSSFQTSHTHCLCWVVQW